MNVFHARRGLVLAALLVATSVSALAQSNINPLDFTYVYKRIGGEVGLSSVWQSGSYTAGCGTFEKGAKINPLIAVSYDQPIGTTFRIEAMVGYQGRLLSSTYNSRESVVLQTSNTMLPVDIDFENDGTASFQYLFAVPSFKFYPVKNFFVGAGFGINLLLSATTQYTKTIISRTVDLSDLGQTEVFYPESESSDPYTKTFDPQDRSDASGIGLDGVAYLGAEFNATDDVYIVPRLLYTYPFTSVLSAPSLKENTLQFLVGVRFNMK